MERVAEEILFVQGGMDCFYYVLLLCSFLYLPYTALEHHPTHRKCFGSVQVAEEEQGITTHLQNGPSSTSKR